MNTRALRLRAAMVRAWPDSLFGRLALLLVVVAVFSHALALSLMFELRPLYRPPHGESAQHFLLPTEVLSLAPAPDPDHSNRPPGPPLAISLIDIGVRLGAALLAAWIGARWLSAPLRRLARATQKLAGNIHGAPLQLEGTRECREAGAVINQMQKNILAQLHERDQFVAAVSHDLRTPLTRLALRAESLADADERQRFGADIREMDQMIRATLDHLCGTAEAEPHVLLDLGSLIDSLVLDYQDIGKPVSLRAVTRPGASAPRIMAQVSAMRRCIGNLIDNAVIYGGATEVAVSEDAQSVRVLVTDQGPGIPDAALKQVLLPFVRLERSRNRNTGGVGLGLASVNDIARRHGGKVVLRNRPGGGLQAELVLPRSPEQPGLDDPLRG